MIWLGRNDFANIIQFIITFSFFFFQYGLRFFSCTFLNFNILNIKFYNSESPQGFFINYSIPKNISGYINRGFETTTDVITTTSNDIVTTDQCLDCPTESISNENTSVLINSSSNFKDIELKNSTVDIIQSTIFVSGDALFTNSKLQISSSSILINGTLTIDNVPITMSLDSYLHVNGCININDSSNLIVNVENQPSNGEKYTLIDSSCINGKFQTVTLKGEKLDPCVKILQQYTETQFTIMFVTSNCNMQNYNFLIWLVPICIAIPIVLIIVSIVIVCKHANDKKLEMDNMMKKVGSEIQLKNITTTTTTSSRSLECDQNAS